MRPALYKCTNHLGCLLGYHFDDIEIHDGMAPTCPECGSLLKPAPKPRSRIFDYALNLLVLAAIGTGAWFAWPHAAAWWERFTAPPNKTAPK